MNDRLDRLFDRLKAVPIDRNLCRLEADVWARIGRGQRQDLFGGRTLQIQIAVSCAALLLGLLVAQYADMSFMPMPLNSELVVLSDDSLLAPSVLLEGGT